MGSPKMTVFLTACLMGTAAVMAIGGAEGQGLPIVGKPVGRLLDGVVEPVTDRLVDPTRGLINDVTALAQTRIDRLTRLVRDNRTALELDDQRNPAVKGQIIGAPASPEALDSARAAGFSVLSDETIEGLDVRSVVLAVPSGMSLVQALKQLRKVAPGEWSANQLHFESGIATPFSASSLIAESAASRPRIGIIDGGVARHPALAGVIEQRGFVSGAPAPSVHGTAIASLIVGEGSINGVIPRVPLLAADVYGRDPAGGNALAIARAIGWMAQRGVPVVSISLVGPPNLLLARVIAAAQSRAMVIVAAVGNDGPAAPPAYPASYPGVIAVTGVDGRNRALIEAGRALHLDYAAPGADMVAANLEGGVSKIRGTSYAAPLVASRIASHYDISGATERAASLSAVDHEARDLGKSGPDRIYGRGLVCGDCATRR